MTKITNEAIAVLSASTINSDSVKLPETQLSRPLYEEINEVLIRLGGKWKSGKVKAHVFPYSPASLLQAVVATGEMPPKNPLAFFATPEAIAKEMLSYVGDLNGKTVLEPSAGIGGIADVVREIYPSALLDLVEIDEFRASILKEKGYAVKCQDFLTLTGKQYDCILMNPPFSVEGDKVACLTHINHAYSMLKPGGRLVAISAPGFTFRSDKKHSAFRDLVGSNYFEIDAGAFKESGTNIKTVLLWLDKTQSSSEELAT